MADLIVRGGLVVDGTGKQAREADVLIEAGLVRDVVAPGTVASGDAPEIDATDRIVTPGFVDVHTHYDGQATWDPVLAPSSWHGVTTVVMGNCGVGFAPVRPDRHQFLIELMEGVEDIPGSALADGITWNWESFPEYLDELDRLPRMIDVAAQVPHGSIRAYVMDARGTSEHHANAEEIARMAAIARESVEAGAVGFATNRLPLHTSIHGDPVPGTFAAEDELLAMMRAVRDTGKGLLQSVPAGAMGEDPSAPLREVELYRKLSLETGCVVTFTLAQIQTDPRHWEAVLAATERANAEGARLVPQVAGRPAGLLMSWGDFQSVHGAAELCGARRPADRGTARAIARAGDAAGDPRREAGRRRQLQSDREQLRHDVLPRRRSRLRARDGGVDCGARGARRSPRRSTRL